MKRFLIAIALLCVLSGSAFAGDIPMDAPAPPPGDAHTIGAQSPGNMPPVGNAAPGEMPTIGLTALLTILDLAF